MYVAKTKALISYAVIRAFVFANAKSRFSHDVAQVCNNGDRSQNRS